MMQVVVVCPSEAGLQEEMDLLQQIQAVVAEGDRRHVMAYISDPARNPEVTLYLLELETQETLGIMRYYLLVRCMVMEAHRRTEVGRGIYRL